MTAPPRYAIYYAPEPGSQLDRFGTQCLGYDAHSGEELPFPADLTESLPDWREVSGEPRKYGFHATLKAPFFLASGTTEAALIEACEGFARTPRPIPLIRPVVDSIGGFIAVVPTEPVAELTRLAADCVRDFDAYRAPLSDADRARRQPAALTPRQRDYLDRWGYPYVMEEFRFHMTLTGRLTAGRREIVLTMLGNSFSGLGLKQLAIDRIAVFRQDNPAARFRVIGSVTLSAPRPA